MVSVIVLFAFVSSRASSIRLTNRRGTRQSRRPTNVMRTPRSLQLVAAPSEDRLVEPHEVAHLVDRPAPVLGRERVDGEPLHAELERAVDGVEERFLASSMALGAGQASLLCPPPVAVHHTCDVDGDAVRVDALETGQTVEASHQSNLPPP